MSRLIVAVAATLILALPGVAAGASALRLQLTSAGDGARAAWKAHAGLPDPTSNNGGDHALVLEKRVSTSTFGAAIADVDGIAGTPVTGLAKVQWNRRSDTYCSGGSPRWSLSIDGASGAPHTVSLGCAQAAHSPGDHDLWTMDFWGSDTIRAAVLAQAGEDAVGGTLAGLAIVFDEGPASVLLDNLVVTTATAEGRWYGPGG